MPRMTSSKTGRTASRRRRLSSRRGRRARSNPSRLPRGGACLAESSVLRGRAMEVLGEDSGSGGGPDLTSYVKQARRGFRSDVVQLLSALEQADLLIPLRESLPGATDGERTKIDGELRVIPHFLPAPEGAELCALFTRAELLDAIATELGWQTAGGELQFCSVPGGVALEMANSSIDGEQVRGLVIDAASESELMLTPAEVRSLVRGQAIPLVGYVQAIPDDDH